MRENLLDLLRCPFCGGRFGLLENRALVREGADVASGVIWCACCAFPVVAGIPVLRADDDTRAAMHALEAGRHEEALFGLLGLDQAREHAFRALLQQGPSLTYRAAVQVLSPDAEGTYFVYRFSDPTFVMAEAVLRALGQEAAAFPGRVLDLCGGSGHLTRVLTTLQPQHEVVLADIHFWKLWLARTFTAPAGVPVCCDANLPLPFARGTFPTVVLSDAFPYIWHKRLLADEMVRQAGPGGTIVMPHLHSALGWNHSAGMTLTPAAYQELFSELAPRLFGDERLLAEAIEGTGMDLSAHARPEALEHESSVTLVASRHAVLFRRYEAVGECPVVGDLAVNPLYSVARRGSSSVLTLRFPTPEYEEEFAACRRYLPDTVTIESDLSGPITMRSLGPEAEALRRRRVILDVPARYG